MSDRLGIIRVQPEMLVRTLVDTAETEVVEHGLPLDAKIIRAQYNFNVNAFEMIIESESFELVLPGCMIPVLTPPVLRLFSFVR